MILARMSKNSKAALRRNADPIIMILTETISANSMSTLPYLKKIVFRLVVEMMFRPKNNFP